MKRDQPKDINRDLPVDVRDSIATLALSRLKNRSRLEHLAKGSVWNRLWWTLPLVLPVGMLGLASIPGAASEMSSLDPLLAFFLVSLISGTSACLHYRIDAIYRLMKDDFDSLAARLNRLEKAIAPESKSEAE